MLWVHKFSVRSVLLALGFAVLSPLIGAIAAEKLTAFYPFFPFLYLVSAPIPHKYYYNLVCYYFSREYRL